MKSGLLAMLVAWSVLSTSPAAFAQHPQSPAGWPQWGGPNRDFTLPSAAPLQAWGAAGPRRMWSRAIGDGFAAIVTSGSKGFTVYRDNAFDVVIAFDVVSGRTLWETRLDAPFVETCSHKLGAVPRATPLVTGQWVISASAGGLIAALDLKTGNLVWQRDLFANAPMGPRACGYSSSPVAFGDSVIVLTGLPGRSIMALRRSDGTVAWQRHDFAIAYSSPTIVQIGGRPELVALMAQYVLGLDPYSGDLRWQHAHTTADDVNVAMPVVTADGIVLLSSGYDGGARALELTRQGEATHVRQLWEHKRFRVHFGTMIRVDNVVIGSNGDFGPAPLTAIDLKTGKVLWRDRAVSRASLILVGNQALILDEDGVLALASPSAAGPGIEVITRLLDSQSWTPPTISGDLLLVRNRTTVAAYTIRDTNGKH